MPEHETDNVTCPRCDGRGEVATGRDPETNAVVGAPCRMCRGDGRLPADLLAEIERDDDPMPATTADYGPPPF